jgi:hypothetical protein
MLYIPGLEWWRPIEKNASPLLITLAIPEQVSPAGRFDYAPGA